jgi:hypothetical protein
MWLKNIADRVKSFRADHHSPTPPISAFYAADIIFIFSFKKSCFQAGKIN